LNKAFLQKKTQPHKRLHIQANAYILVMCQNFEMQTRAISTSVQLVGQDEQVKYR